MKRATFRDAETVRKARAERRRREREAGESTTTNVGHRAQTTIHDGHRIQPRLPLHTMLHVTCDAARFMTAAGGPWVEAVVRIGDAAEPVTVRLTLAQAVEADIVERVDDEPCRCPVCNGRSDDPAGIHGRR